MRERTKIVTKAKQSSGTIRALTNQGVAHVFETYMLLSVAGIVTLVFAFALDDTVRP